MIYNIIHTYRNCGSKAGSCHGGNHISVYEFIHKKGSVPFDTCLLYEACSSESKEGSCASSDYTCKPINTMSLIGVACNAGERLTSVTTTVRISMLRSSEVLPWGSVSSLVKLPTTPHSSCRFIRR